MAQSLNRAATLLVHCDDQAGLVASVTRFIHQYRGNILDLDQHTDKEHKKFFMRVAWELQGFTLAEVDIGSTFSREVAEPVYTARKVFMRCPQTDPKCSPPANEE